MKRVIEYFAGQGLFWYLLTGLVMVVGVYSLLTVRREVMPNVKFEVITVTTLYAGSPPEDVERLITNPLEQDLNEVDGIKKMSSVSTEGRSVIVLQLDPDQTTEEQAKSDIQEVVDRFFDLPKEAEKPVVQSIESKLSPLIQLSVAGELSAIEKRQIAKSLGKEIENLSDVARVVFEGLQNVEIRVEAQVEKLSRYQVSLEDLIEALRKTNVSIPGGTIGGGGPEILVRTMGTIENIDEIKKTVIRANDWGKSVTIDNVAKVRYDLEKPTTIHKINGQQAVNITILKKQKADAIELVDSVKKLVEQLQPTFDSRVKLVFTDDISYFIRRRLNILTNNLVIGLVLVFSLLSLFLPTRVGVLTAIGIPFSFLIVMACFSYLDIGLNLISVMGLIIVAGMLVDDAIVVTENSTRLIEQGMPPQRAAIEGASQVFMPVLASVATTMAAFLPMLFMSGIMGKFVKFIPMGVILALGASLFECFFILPHHFGRWVKSDALASFEKKPRRLNFKFRFNRFWEKSLIPRFKRLLTWTVGFRYWVMLGLVGAIIVSVWLVKTQMRLVLMPGEAIEIFFIRVDTPVGTGLAATEKALGPIEKIVNSLPAEELDAFITKVGIQRQGVEDPNTKRATNSAQITVYLTPEEKRTRVAHEIIEDLRGRVGKPEGIEKLTFSRLTGGPPVGSPISIGVRGQEYEGILPAVEDLKTIVMNTKGSVDIDDSYVEGKKEVQVKVNSSEAAAAGLSVGMIGTTVRAAYEGIIATTLRQLDEKIGVRVSLAASDRTQVGSLMKLFVPNPRGQLVPLSSVAQLESHQGVAVFEHEANERQVRVVGDVASESSSLEVNSIIKEKMAHLKAKYPQLRFVFGGEDADTKESLNSLWRSFLIAIFGIFLLLVFTFESFIQPLLVLITIPIGLIAVVWTFYFHSMPLSFMGLLGVVALSGVIVNNAIVYIDFVNQEKRAGLSILDSVISAGVKRIRPIFLTTMTTVCGILPTAYGLGGLDKFVVPIAMSLGWGILLGSVLTLICLPAAIVIADDMGRLFHRLKAILRVQ